jgi:putative flippase GtrA
MIDTIFRFAVVGILTAVLYYSLLLLGVELLSLSPTLASGICFLIVIVFNYLVHYSWTFAQRAPHGEALKRYLIMISCGFVINTTVMYVGAQVLSLQYLLVQAVALLVVVVWNFSVSNVWVFRSSPLGNEER